MGRQRNNITYDTFKLPSTLTKMIDAEVKSRGFTSRTDYLKYLVRKDVENYKKINEGLNWKERYVAERVEEIKNRK